MSAVRLCIFLVCLSGLQLVDAAAGTINVFLIGGQSNADGRADLSGIPSDLSGAQTDVPFYYGVSNSGSSTIRAQAYTTLQPGLSNTSQFGPEVTFGRSMADSYEAKGGQIAIIKYANGGTDLAVEWKAGGTAATSGDGTIYKNFQTIVTAGLGALQAAFPSDTIKISGMIWMQGESDANSNSTQYEANLSAFIDDIRLTYGANLPFVIGQLSTNQTGTNSDAGGTTADRDRVRAAQAAVAETKAHAALVVTDSFSLKSDNLHFNTSGQLALGSAFAAQMQGLLVKTVKPTLSLTGKVRVVTHRKRVVVRGTASAGSSALSSVETKVGGSVVTARGTTKWRLPVRLTERRTALRIQAVSEDGTRSKAIRVTVIRK